MKPLDTIASGRDRALSRQPHDDRTAAILGIALGICFATCFVTGLYSHVLQHPPDWLSMPPRPAGLYRVTQGLHVATGLATIPLLLAKLWSVFPRLFAWPPVLNVAHAIERLMLIPLVCGSVFLLFSGVSNVARWYPWPFFFPAAHYWVAWITVGALIVHIGAKAGTARAALSRQSDPGAHVVRQPPSDGLGRRGFLTSAATATGIITLTTAGQTVTPLRPLTLFAQRRPDIGSQGVPVNKSAIQAGIDDIDTLDTMFRLRVTGDVGHEREFTADELDAIAVHEVILPIACVEGWSVSARWRGIPISWLLETAGVDSDRDVQVKVESLQRGGRYRASELNHRQARDPDTMVAVALNGERLNLDHGYPGRLIGPNRPGVMQTKWVTELVVRT